jgi:hypothetical protein
METGEKSSQGGIEMSNATSMDRKVLLSTLWIFAMFNYIYADVYGLYFNPVLQKELWQRLAEGFAGTIPITQGFVLITAVLMETAIAMVILTRVLKRGANRWVNVVAGAFHTVFVAWTLVGDPVSLFYLFFAVVEMACTLLIVWLALRWKPAAEPAAA